MCADAKMGRAIEVYVTLTALLFASLGEQTLAQGNA